MEIIKEKKIRKQKELDENILKELRELVLNTYKSIPKTLNPRKKDNGQELRVYWELFDSPNSKSERDIFINNQLNIHKADKNIIEAAKFCEKNNIPYSLKLCKSKKMQTDTRIPPLLTSYLTINPPVFEDYFENTNEDIVEAEAEFTTRKEYGLYTNEEILNTIQ